jgi:hypothetical protein
MLSTAATQVDYWLGLDLGRSHEYCALAVMERHTCLDPSIAAPTTYALRMLKRWPIGTKYAEIVVEVLALVRKPPFDYPTVAIDQTGVGSAVVDLFRSAEIAAMIRTVQITAGHAKASRAGGVWHVPKDELTSILQVLLQARRLQISSRLEHARTLQKELQEYRVKIPPVIDASDASWRDHEHEDLVLATALGCWLGEDGYLADMPSIFNVEPSQATRMFC